MRSDDRSTLRNQVMRYAENARCQTLLPVPQRSLSLYFFIAWIEERTAWPDIVVYAFFEWPASRYHRCSILTFTLARAAHLDASHVPLMSGAVLSLAGWELVTSVLRWFPLPIFRARQECCRVRITCPRSSKPLGERQKDRSRAKVAR